MISGATDTTCATGRLPSSVICSTDTVALGTMMPPTCPSSRSSAYIGSLVISERNWLRPRDDSSAVVMGHKVPVYPNKRDTTKLADRAPPQGPLIISDKP